MKTSFSFAVAAFVTLGSGLAAAPAVADVLGFVTPSKNILCGIASYDDGTWVRCDMSELTPSFTKQPADCEFDWGSSFAVGVGEPKGVVACVSDVAASGDLMTLQYGKSVSFDGITCVSEKSGVTCTNPKGHGFKISKAKQTLF